jgi:hypothetical protein
LRREGEQARGVPSRYSLLEIWGKLMVLRSEKAEELYPEIRMVQLGLLKTFELCLEKEMKTPIKAWFPCFSSFPETLDANSRKSCQYSRIKT